MVTLKVIRDGKTQDINVKLKKQASAPESSQSQSQFAQ